MNKKIAKIFAIIGGLLVTSYLLFALFFLSSENRDLVSEQMQIVFVNDNLGLIDEQFVVQVLTERNLLPVGRKTQDIRLEAIERALLTHEAIKSVDAFITPSGVTFIRIRQREPVFRVFPNVGTSYYIDTERNRINSTVNHAAHLPIVSGNVSVEKASGELFDFIMFLERNAFWRAQIEQIYVRADRQIELVPRVGDGIILLGTLDNYQSKLEKLRRLYSSFSTIGWDRYRIIDLRFRGQIVGTRR